MRKKVVGVKSVDPKSETPLVIAGQQFVRVFLALDTVVTRRDTR